MIDYCSYPHNLSSCENKAWKIHSGLCGIRTHNPLWYRGSALPNWANKLTKGLSLCEFAIPVDGWRYKFLSSNAWSFIYSLVSYGHLIEKLMKISFAFDCLKFYACYNHLTNSLHFSLRLFNIEMTSKCSTKKWHATPNASLMFHHIWRLTERGSIGNNKETKQCYDVISKNQSKCENNSSYCTVSSQHLVMITKPSVEWGYIVNGLNPGMPVVRHALPSKKSYCWWKTLRFDNLSAINQRATNNQTKSPQ